MTKIIIDTSNNNPATAQQVKESKSVALICKATEGDNFKDGWFLNQRSIAKSLNIPFGSYLFLHANSKGNEAQFYLDDAKPKKGDIQPIIDAETTDGESFDAVAARVDSCAKTLEAQGFKPILYASSSFWQELYRARPSLKRLRVWEADYPGAFTRWFPWLSTRRIKLSHGASVVMWQWSQNYLVGGRAFDVSNLLTDISNILI